MSDTRPGFITVENYAAEPRQPKKWKNGQKIPGVRGAYSILAEGDRSFASTPHIEHPLPPLLCYGIHPLEIIPEMEAVMRAGRSKSGRKLRKDSRILGGGVASFPYTVEEVSKDARLQEELRQWIVLCVRFLKKQWLTELRSIVLHTDEPYPHIHFYALATLQDGVAMLDELHPGKKASCAARQDASAGPVLMKHLRDAYVKGLRDFQHDYYVEVSAPLGHARYGDLQPRIPRSQVQAVRAQEKGLGAAWRNLQLEQDEHAARLRQLERDRQLLLAERQALEFDKAEFERVRAGSSTEREELRRWSRWAKANGESIPAALNALLTPEE